MLELIGQRFEVLGLPGHTIGQIGFWCESAAAVFTGDTLFSCGCGRLFEGTAEQMWTSLRRLADLPPNTALYFGHEYTLNNIAFLKAHDYNSVDLQNFESECKQKISIGEYTVPAILETEVKINPFLNAPSVEVFRHWRTLRNSW